MRKFVAVVWHIVDDRPTVYTTAMCVISVVGNLQAPELILCSLNESEYFNNFSHLKVLLKLKVLLL